MRITRSSPNFLAIALADSVSITSKRKTSASGRFKIMAKAGGWVTKPFQPLRR